MTLAGASESQSCADGPFIEVGALEENSLFQDHGQEKAEEEITQSSLLLYSGLF